MRGKQKAKKPVRRQARPLLSAADRANTMFEAAKPVVPSAMAPEAIRTGVEVIQRSMTAS